MQRRLTTSAPIHLRSHRHRLSSAVVFLLALFSGLTVRAEKVEQLQPQGYVSDFAGILDAQAKAQVNTLCAEVDEKAHAQIAVVTIRSLEGIPDEEFAVNLATRWGVGHRGDNRGVLILLVPSEHRYRIEVGYGLEPILPDGKVGGFGREMVPLLRQGDYAGALLQLTARIAEVIAQDRGVTLSAKLSGLRRLRAARPDGSVNGLLLTLLPFFVPLGLLFFFRLLAAAQGTSGTRRRRFGPGWWIWPGGSYGGGGSWGSGGGSWGGGGFGGFGGGGFGGGGASGSW